MQQSRLAAGRPRRPPQSRLAAGRLGWPLLGRAPMLLQRLLRRGCGASSPPAAVRQECPQRRRQHGEQGRSLRHGGNDGTGFTLMPRSNADLMPVPEPLLHPSARLSRSPAQPD